MKTQKHTVIAFNSNKTERYTSIWYRRPFPSNKGTNWYFTRKRRNNFIFPFAPCKKGPTAYNCTLFCNVIIKRESRNTLIISHRRVLSDCWRVSNLKTHKKNAQSIIFANRYQQNLLLVFTFQLLAIERRVFMPSRTFTDDHKNTTTVMMIIWGLMSWDVELTFWGQ